MSADQPYVNKKTRDFLMLLTSRPDLTKEEAFAFLGGKNEFMYGSGRDLDKFLGWSESQKRFVLFPEGKDYIESLLESEKALRDQESKQEAQKREEIAEAARRQDKQFKHDWRVRIVSALIGAVFGSILTLIIEHLF